MHLTVALCTWNRANLLNQTLERMRQLAIPEGCDWEILVGDNNCTDQTASVVERHAAHLPVRRLFEPRPGKSYAANLLLEQAQGDVILWTDDDVLVQSDWIAAYVDAFKAMPHVSFFAGAIEPWFETEPPKWIRKHLSRLAGVYAVAAYGNEVRPLRPADGVFGANMAFRTDVARAFPLNTDLGRVRGLLIGGDDTELIQRVTGAGHLGYWLPTARVQHFIPSNRLNAGYVWKWYYGAGLNVVRQNDLGDCPRFLGAPRWALWAYAKALAKAYLCRPLRGCAWLQAFQDAARFRGVIAEARAPRPMGAAQ